MASKGVRRKQLGRPSREGRNSETHAGDNRIPARGVKYREYKPVKLLEEDVKCFWMLENTYPDGGVQDVTPDGCVEFIFNFGSPYVPLNRGSGSVLPKAFIIGFQNKTIRLKVSGTVKLVAVRMFPWAAVQLLQSKDLAFYNKVRGIGAGWNKLVEELGDQVSRGEYDHAVFHLQDFLIKRTLIQRFDRRIVQAAAKIIQKTKGQYRIAELAEYCRLSVRQLQRGFRSAVGTTPKVLARTVRFVAAQRVLMFNPNANLTELTYECGYFDQAHFIKDFKEFSGKTPSEYAKETRRFQQMLKSKDVVFLHSD